MPSYSAGDYKVDHPPLFACREHKQFLRFTETFITDILEHARDIVPGNLSEIAQGFLGGDASAFKLPDYLIPPRVVLYNPAGLRGAAALPFTLVFIDKKFVGVPGSYLTRDRFEGCPDCAAAPPPPEPPRAATRPAATAAAASGTRPPPPPRPPSGQVPVPTGVPGSRPAPPRDQSGSGAVRTGGAIPAPAPAKRPAPPSSPPTGSTPRAPSPTVPPPAPRNTTPPSGTEASGIRRGEAPKRPAPPRPPG